jgi:hypothetical protein
MKRQLLALGLASFAAVAHAGLSVADGYGPRIPISGYDGVPATFTGVVTEGMRDGYVKAGNDGLLSITYLGSDNATRLSTFTLGDIVISNQSTPVGSSFSTQVKAGALDFFFNDTQGAENWAWNGYSLGYPTYVAALSPDGRNALGGYQVVLGWDDGDNDRDFDDLVLGFTLTPAPEPATYALMLAGLAAVGWHARRKRQA